MPGSPRRAPRPPATKTGTSRMCGRISCASTISETGPICPPASRPLDHQRVRARPDQPLRQHQGRGERDQLRAAVLHRPHRPAGRNAAGQHDVSDARLQADPDQLVEPRMHGDQVDPERPVGQRLRAGDLGGQHVRLHRAAGDHAEPAGVGDRRHQVALADPAHRAAHDGDLAAEERRAARPQPVELPRGPRSAQRREWRCQAASRP